MKSSNTSFSRRALVAAAVIMATGSVSAFAQNADQTTPSGSNNSNYQNSSTDTQNSTSNNNMSSNDNNMSSSNDNMSSSKNDNSSSKLGWSDRHFVTKAAKGNADEIKLAQLAADRATNPDVKSFAQQLVNDHTKMGQDLQTLASNKGVDLTKDENKEQNSESHDYKKLSKASGSDFDRQFVEHMVSDHKKDVKEFKDRADDAKDPDLKSFAQTQLPTLQHHLQMAQQLQSSVAPTGRSGSESYRPASDTSSGAANTNASATGSTGASSSDNMNSTTNSGTANATPSTK